MHYAADKTKWVLYFIKTGVKMKFDNEVDCQIAAFEFGDNSPVRLIAPIYRSE